MLPGADAYSPEKLHHQPVGNLFQSWLALSQGCAQDFSLGPRPKDRKSRPKAGVGVLEEGKQGPSPPARCRVTIGDCLAVPRSKASNLVKEGWDTDGKHLRRWRTLGALKDDLQRIKASCEFISRRYKVQSNKSPIPIFPIFSGLRPVCQLEMEASEEDVCHRSHYPPLWPRWRAHCLSWTTS